MGVFGLSGGLDSAVVAALAVRALGKVPGSNMPCYSEAEDVSHGSWWLTLAALQNNDLGPVYDLLMRQ